MSEAQSLSKIKSPNTLESLSRDLLKLGVGEGMCLIVHSSLSSLGWVCGGPIAVIQALMKVVGPSGTIVMPTHTSSYSEPSLWENPPVPESWWQEIRETMPAYNPQITPTAYMGKIPETFRNFPGVKRSNHPAVSFASWGKHSELITLGHGLEFSMGRDSPLAKIYDLSGMVLLLGTDHSSNTSFHLAESKIDNMPTKMEGAPILANGKRVWMPYQDYLYDSSDFIEIGTAYENLTPIKQGKVGSAICKLMNQPSLVDFAVKWLQQNR